MAGYSDAYAALWGLKHRSLRGKAYSFIDYKHQHRHRPFLYYPLLIQPKVKGYKKSRQAGVSESSVTESLWALDNHKMNIVYTFPSPKQVEDFSNTRVKTALDSLEGKEGLAGDPQNVTLRQIGNGFLFLRSSTNEKLGEGIDADMVVFDEIDRMRRNVGVAFKESLSASKWGWVRELSTPTLPGRGIDETWQKSNQMTWFVKCEACGKSQPLKFPESILEVKKVKPHEKLIPPGSYAFCCSKCKSTKLNRWDGFWVPAYRDRDAVCFAINQLMCVWISADEIMQKKRDYKFPQLFWNYVLGLEYLGNSQLLTRTILERLIDTELKLYTRRTAEYTTISVGIDWGQFNWAVVIGRRADGRKDLIGLKVAEDSSEPLASAKEIADFIRPFKPDIIVPDLGYGKDRCAYMLGQFPGRVYNCSYVENSKVILPRFSDSSYSVNVDRTAWLKGVANTLREGELVLPDYEYEPLLDTFISHLASICVLVEEDESGKVRERIESTGDDHLAHAAGYAFMGLEYGETGEGVFAFEFI